jgi:hypothetical protein
MKVTVPWQVWLGAGLLLLSAVGYYVHYLIFRDAHHIFLYLIGDIAFVFVEVLLVTMVLHQLLHFREKKAMLNKLNMVIGAFFSEVGTELLRSFTVYDAEASRLTEKLLGIKDCSERDVALIRRAVSSHVFAIASNRGDLKALRDFLRDRRQFLLRLLENPNLLEHESFTNLLWAVFHLTEELISRSDLTRLPENDYKHLSGDIKRVYEHLIVQWLDYMHHLKSAYPYLFSLAVRTNPFDVRVSVEIK